jgi:phosphatidylserine/phosphatidylglycerophosphate/cardiolipin synthase-like enzyme
VMTGSTNWTSNGLCAQSNNAMIVESPALAQHYLDYWEHLLEDTNTFTKPRSDRDPTTNKQGADLRTDNAKPIPAVVLADGTSITPWFAPNTKQATKPSKNPATPPDLGAVYALMKEATQAILFAVFLPSRQGKNSIVQWAIEVGQKKKLLVYGACSDPTVLPNYKPAKKGAGKGRSGPKPVQPATYDKGSVHIVRAAALTENDVAGAFEQEILKPAGANAIIHDKILVVDPLSPNGFVAMGSHNVGFKASYENDENLLIIRNNPSVIQAYAAHVLDVYDHYRFRAVQLELSQEHKKTWDGFLTTDDSWYAPEVDAQTGALAHYLSGAP